METWREFLHGYGLPFNTSLTFQIQNSNVGRVIHKGKQLDLKKHDRRLLTDLLEQYTTARYLGVGLSEKLTSPSLTIGFNDGLPANERDHVDELLNECRRVDSMSEEEYSEYKKMYHNNIPIHFREKGTGGVEMRYAVSAMVRADVY